MLLPPKKSIELIKKHNLPLAKSILIKNKKELLKALTKIKFPIALKLFSEKAIHKTELKLIRLSINSQEKALKEFNELLKINKKKKLRMQGILVQEMVLGQELIIGLKEDSCFENLMLFGLGGIFVEILKDYSIRIPPINEVQAMQMIKELKGIKLLKGFRGKEKVNLKKLSKLLVKVSKIAAKEKFKEIDFNPVIANSKEVKIIDFRIIK